MEAIKTKGLLDLTDPASVGVSGPPSGTPTASPPEPGRDLEEDAAGEGELIHSDAVMEAMQSNDREGFRDALKAFVMSCVREGERGGY